METHWNFNPGGNGMAVALGGQEVPAVYGGKCRTIEQAETAAAPEQDLGGGTVGVQAHTNQGLALLAELDGPPWIFGWPWRNAIARFAFPNDRRR